VVVVVVVLVVVVAVAEAVVVVVVVVVLGVIIVIVVAESEVVTDLATGQQPLMRRNICSALQSNAQGIGQILWNDLINRKWP
jgi:hypothetical protein